MSRSECRSTTPEELSSIITVPKVSREALIRSIDPGMKLTKNFFLKIYGYEISWSGFKNQALTTLEQVGCSRARTYYEEIVGEYQRSRDESMRPVAAAYVKELNEKWEMRQKGSEGHERAVRRASFEFTGLPQDW